MIVKICVLVLCMHLVVVGLNLQGSQDKQTTKRAMLQTVSMARRITTQQAMLSTLLQTKLMTRRATTQRAMPSTLLQTISMTRRATTQREMPSMLQTVLMATPTIPDNMLRHGLHNSTTHGPSVSYVSSGTSQSAETRVAELSTITTPSLQEAAMQLFIWNLTDKLTGHDAYDHFQYMYGDYLHYLYVHCARKYGWKYCLEGMPVVLPLCNDIRANRTYNGSIQRHPYIFEYFDYYNIDVHNLACQHYVDLNQINDGVRLAISIVTTVLGSLGLLGNVLSIITIYKADKELTSTSIYLIALAVSDSVFVLVRIASRYILLECEMDEIVNDVLSCISAWFLVVITIERFNSIYNPFTVQDHCNPRSAKIYVAIVTVICSAIGITMYLSGVYEQFCYPTTDKEQYDAVKDIEVTWIVLVFLSPFVLMIVLNIAIIRSLYIAAKQRQTVSKSDLDKEKQITRTLVIVTIAYLILIGPHYTFNFIRRFASEYYDYETHERIIYTIHFLDLLQMVNYCVNFLIYTQCGSKYRDSFLKLLKQIQCKHHTHIV